MSEKIIKSEAELLSAAIEKIVNAEVLEKDISGALPKIDELHDSNKIYTGKVSVLFVDMRNSTKLPERFDAEQLVKIYRSYVRSVVQAVRYSGGVVRDFMGDGVLAVFVDNETEKSEDKAVYAARYITTAIDKFLNPILDKKINHRISCGIGIHTGEISLSKVGMKGKEQDETSENEFGIAWIGNSTNLACKQCGAVECGTIFISNSTYSALSDINKKDVWKAVDIQKGNNTLCGYVAEHYYLALDEEIAPCIAEGMCEPVNVISIIQTKVDELAKSAKELGKHEQELNKKQKELKEKELVLNKKEQLLQTKEKSTKVLLYKFYCDVLGSGHCKKEYAKAMGQDFWEENLEKAISAGRAIGKDEHKVKQEISYTMVSIYESLELYDKAYDFVVEQAAGYPWLHLFTVQDIVRKVGYCSRLKSAIYERLAKNDLTDENRRSFEDIKNWLVFSYESNLNNW